MTEKKKTDGTGPNFEAAIKRLEEIVRLLEGESVPLEQTVKLFEEGTRLIALCNAKLDEVKHKVEVVIKNRGKYEVKPFDESKDSDEEEEADDKLL